MAISNFLKTKSNKNENIKKKSILNNAKSKPSISTDKDLNNKKITQILTDFIQIHPILTVLVMIVIFIIFVLVISLPLTLVKAKEEAEVTMR
jgi:hypothetical protein